MTDATTSGTTPSALQLTDDQIAALGLSIARAFPPWRIWQSDAGTWYATSPCRLPGCDCPRTLHSATPSGLCEQLVAIEESGRARRGAAL
ncbi:hypothetical protein [Streptosporangium sp. G12]